ncbi:MAG TPA: MBL fold metallo-hydrolase [Hyphomicrobiales bacterium]|nr:MBL fold metallo-hydrolase [Hyphomicrobiales bacterium]
MRPLLHPALVNGRTGDPALYIETLFEKRAILFDLGDLSALPPRKVYRIEHIFVSHTHIDHFFGFDRLLRLLVGREKKLNLYGPVGFIEQVRHKLAAYSWNLVDRYLCDLSIVATEVSPALDTRTAQFRLKNGFAAEPLGESKAVEGVLYSEPAFQISTALLEHRIPCLCFAIEEMAHVNIWKNKLSEMALEVGPWLHELKRAVIEHKPDDHVIRVVPSLARGHESELRPLHELRHAVTVTPGQKIVYVTDVADTASNRAAILKLADGADLFFIEATFAEADAALAAERAHLTTAAAGSIARRARARRVEPFHFSARYGGEEDKMLAEVMTAFASPEPDVRK